VAELVSQSEVLATVPGSPVQDDAVAQVGDPIAGSAVSPGVVEVVDCPDCQIELVAEGCEGIVSEALTNAIFERRSGRRDGEVRVRKAVHAD
jgi:hypothetical protein